MFSKISRYRKLPDVVTVDVKGRRLESRSLRLSPKVEARLLHTLEEGERLDHLAHKYYQQTRNWWRICDASPQVLSPWELVDAEPRTTLRLEITWIGRDPPWPLLLAGLRRSPGVESALLGNAEARFPTLVIDGDTGVESHVWYLALTFNRITTTVEDLVGRIKAEGFAAGTPEKIGRVGKPLPIPPRAS